MKKYECGNCGTYYQSSTWLLKHFVKAHKVWPNYVSVNGGWWSVSPIKIGRFP